MMRLQQQLQQEQPERQQQVHGYDGICPFGGC